MTAMTMITWARTIRKNRTITSPTTRTRTFKGIRTMIRVVVGGFTSQLQPKHHTRSKMMCRSQLASPQLSVWWSQIPKTKNKFLLGLLETNYKDFKARQFVATILFTKDKLLF